MGKMKFVRLSLDEINKKSPRTSRLPFWIGRVGAALNADMYGAAFAA